MSKQRKTNPGDNLLGGNVDLTSNGDFPLALAIGLAPAALIASGVGLGLATIFNARRESQKEIFDAAWQASQTSTMVLRADQSPVATEVAAEPECARVKSAYPTPRPNW